MMTWPAKIWAALRTALSRLIDLTVAVIVTYSPRVISPRALLKLVEIKEDEFELRTAPTEAQTSVERVQIKHGHLVLAGAEAMRMQLRGSRIELFLNPERFLFRPLELPNRATEFLDGIIRSQIDRLMPWNANEIAFGWSAPSQVGTDRIKVTVAGATRALLAPYARAFADVGVQSVAVCTTEPEDESQSIKIMEERSASFLDTEKIRRILVITLLTAAVTAGATFVGSTLTALFLDAQKDAISERINEFRAAAGASARALSGSHASAQQKVEERKHQTPPAVWIIESLSQILPDHTSVTELRIEDQKVQIIGLTHDAPSLIKLIEQSGLFTQASFFAPTTHSPAGPGERFHIEAVIRPMTPAHS